MKKIFLLIILTLFSYPILAGTIKNFTINTKFDNSKGVETNMKMKWHNLPIGKLGLSSSIAFNYDDSNNNFNQRFFRTVDLHAYFNIPNDIVKFDFIYRNNLKYYNDNFKNQFVSFSIFAGNINGIPLCFVGKFDFKGQTTVGYKSQIQFKTYYEIKQHGWKVVPTLSYTILDDEKQNNYFGNKFVCSVEIQKEIKLIAKRKIIVFSNASINTYFNNDPIYIGNTDAAAILKFGIKF